MFFNNENLFITNYCSTFAEKINDMPTKAIPFKNKPITYCYYNSDLNKIIFK